jgi:hypothetical protein
MSNEINITISGIINAFDKANPIKVEGIGAIGQVHSFSLDKARELRDKLTNALHEIYREGK